MPAVPPRDSPAPTQGNVSARAHAEPAPSVAAPVASKRPRKRSADDVPGAISPATEQGDGHAADGRWPKRERRPATDDWLDPWRDLSQK